jgi:hypothetical protein
VKAWRRQEQTVLSSARHAPDEVHAFQYDDTTAFSVPHFGNRESKHLLRTYRLHFIPWMVEDVARREQHYIYSFKSTQEEAKCADSVGKGADRWFSKSEFLSTRTAFDLQVHPNVHTPPLNQD